MIPNYAMNQKLKKVVHRPIGGGATNKAYFGSRGIVMIFTATISLLTIYLLRPERIAKNVIDVPKTQPPWKEGYLDIHHIHDGMNVATFMIFLDGTTMLIDCGDLDVPKLNMKYGKETATSPKLSVVSPYPNASKTTGQWVTDYIHHFWPENVTNKLRKVIDILMITHLNYRRRVNVVTISLLDLWR